MGGRTAGVRQAEISAADGRRRLRGEWSDRRADVSIGVHHLRHAETLAQKVGPVQPCAADHVGTGGKAEAKRLDQLIEEQRHAVIDLDGRRQGNRPRRHLRAAPADDCLAV